MKIKKPEYYATPLKRKDHIVGFIGHHTTARSYDYQNHPFCFNVKLRGGANDFDTLLQIYRDDQADMKLISNEEKIRKQELWRSQDTQNSMWEYAIECMRSDVDHSYMYLWDGPKVNVQISFEGRSGGWLSINEFDGVNFNRRDYHNSVREMFLMDQDYQWLRRFYQLVVMLIHDTKKENLKSGFDYHCAQYLFGSFC
jgi:hypothetical protein